VSILFDESEGQRRNLPGSSGSTSPSSSSLARFLTSFHDR
jgi:hypothetical protein